VRLPQLLISRSVPSPFSFPCFRIRTGQHRPLFLRLLPSDEGYEPHSNRKKSNPPFPFSPPPALAALECLIHKFLFSPNIRFFLIDAHTARGRVLADEGENLFLVSPFLLFPRKAVPPGVRPPTLLPMSIKPVAGPFLSFRTVKAGGPLLLASSFFFLLPAGAFSQPAPMVPFFSFTPRLLLHGGGSKQQGFLTEKWERFVTDIVYLPPPFSL